MRYAWERVGRSLAGKVRSTEGCCARSRAWRKHVVHCGCDRGRWDGPVSERSADPERWNRTYFHTEALDNKCPACEMYPWYYVNELLDAMELVRGGEERERRERSQVISSMREVPSRVRVELVQLPFALQRRLPNRAC